MKKWNLFLGIALGVFVSSTATAKYESVYNKDLSQVTLLDPAKRNQDNQDIVGLEKFGERKARVQILEMVSQSEPEGGVSVSILCSNEVSIDLWRALKPADGYYYLATPVLDCKNSKGDSLLLFSAAIFNKFRNEIYIGGDIFRRNLYSEWQFLTYNYSTFIHGAGLPNFKFGSGEPSSEITAKQVTYSYNVELIPEGK